MEFWGLIAFAIVCSYTSLPGKIKKLERKVKYLEHILKGESNMSKLITSLIGKVCKITLHSTGLMAHHTTILDTDMDWVKVEAVTKKGLKSIQIIRIEDIKKIELILDEL